MTDSRNIYISALRSCPRVVGLEYVLIVNNPREPGVSIPVIGTCERDETGFVFFTDDWRAPEDGLFDERKILGWLDFRHEAISDYKLAYNEVAELKKTVLGLKRQLENVLHDKVASPIVVARERSKRKPAGNSRAITNNSVAKADARGSSRAPAQSKREARLLRQIFLDAPL